MKKRIHTSFLSMKNILVASILLVAMQACNGTEDSLEGKMDKLKELKTEAQTLSEEIKTLESEINAMDPSALDSKVNATLITTLPVQQESFIHKIEVRGNVNSRTNAMLSAEMMGRVVRARVQEGDQVTAGQVIVELDRSVMDNNVEELKTSIELARTVFERQKRLWDQNIGTEIQYLQAKNNLEGLERRMQTLESEMTKLTVRAPFAGTIDKLNVRAGEMLSPGSPIALLTSTRDMYVSGEVSERYVGRFAPGDSVDISFPSINIQSKAIISSVGTVINPNNRTFPVEINLKDMPNNVKPNMIASLLLTDYENDNSMVIPTYLILQDRIGSFVWLKKQINGVDVAKKAYIETGNSFMEKTEVNSGLAIGDVLIDKGFREMNEGMNVRLASN
jgi:membrane fusion protein, multidrug efflux system